MDRLKAVTWESKEYFVATPGVDMVMILYPENF